jgi:hypothetical protein
MSSLGEPPSMTLAEGKPSLGRGSQSPKPRAHVHKTVSLLEHAMVRGTALGGTTTYSFVHVGPQLWALATSP